MGDGYNIILLLHKIYDGRGWVLDASFFLDIFSVFCILLWGN